MIGWSLAIIAVVIIGVVAAVIVIEGVPDAIFGYVPVWKWL